MTGLCLACHCRELEVTPPPVVCLNKADSQADRPMRRSIIREDDRTDTPRTGLDSVL